MLVEANVGEKTYDGTVSLNVGDITYTLTGKFATETDTYAVNVLAGHYDDANVFDADGNIADVKGAKLYGVTLSNLSTKIVNYYPVFASAEEIAGLTAITDLGDLPATDENGNAIYYYALGTENVYELTASEFAEVEDTVDMAYFIGKYSLFGQAYYLFKEGANIDGKETKAISVDENAVGKINQREITMIVEVINKDAFNKTYDGTTAFYGEAGVDFDISMTAGFIGEDGEEIALDPNGFEVSYSSAKAGRSAVVFVFGDNAIKGVGSSKTYLNYTATGATYSVKSASINKAEMNAILSGVKATYGDENDEHIYSVDYSISSGSENYAVIINNMKGYMLVDEYAVVYGGHWLSLTEEEQNALRYDLADGVFTQSVTGQYVVLADTFVTPSMATRVTKQTIIGTYEATLVGGSATNHTFKFGYSKFVDGVSTYDGSLTASEL
ncbi:MAG: hypothetical protein IKA59_01580, partial [Clostridia bacterium]|nr:hypothetical protein [Clostridia bacterium]